MDHEIEDRSRPCPHAKCEEHVADLADGRIGQDTFQVMLCQCTESCYQKRECADDSYCCLHCRSQRKEDMRSCYEVNACCHHRGCMDEGTYRRRSGHGVRKPG